VAEQPPAQPADRGIPQDRLANASLGDAWSGIACEQTPLGRVSDGAQGGSTASTPTDIRGEMTASGMTGVSDPPTESQLRTYYSRHAPHHEMIADRRYGDAAAAYRGDAAALPENDPRRASLEQRANQLDYAAHMEQSAQGRNRHVSYPPTWNETKSHFRGMRDQSAQTVGSEYDRYSRAFYNHVQREGDPNADVKYDHESGAVRGERGNWGTDTPEDFNDVSNDRQLNGRGQRLIDCEGYAWMGEQLFKEAGFQQAGGDQGYKLIRPHNTPQGGGYNSHVVVNMTRGQDNVWISNDHAYASANAGQNRRGALADSMRALSGANGGETQFEIYHGATDREATVHGDTRNGRFSD